MITWTVHNSSVVNCWAKEALKNSRIIRLSCQYFSLGGERYRGAATHPRPFRDPEVALPAVSCETYCASGLPGWVRSVVGSFLVKSSLHCAWISWRIHVWTLFQGWETISPIKSMLTQLLISGLLVCWHVRFAYKLQVCQFAESNESISSSLEIQGLWNRIRNSFPRPGNHLPNSPSRVGLHLVEWSVVGPTLVEDGEREHIMQDMGQDVIFASVHANVSWCRVKAWIWVCWRTRDLNLFVEFVRKWWLSRKASTHTICWLQLGLEWNLFALCALLVVESTILRFGKSLWVFTGPTPNTCLRWSVGV